jgi:cell wall-associated NlpC family hydrolase
MSVDAFMSKWDGTLYVEGGDLAGCGVDCVRLTLAWLNHLAGTTFTIKEEAQDGALHSVHVINRVRSLIRGAFPDMLFFPNPKISDLKPGDGVAIGRSGNPYHVGIVSDDGLGLWHAVRPRVCRTSLQAVSVDGFRIKEAFRWIS